MKMGFEWDLKVQNGFGLDIWHEAFSKFCKTTVVRVEKLRSQGGNGPTGSLNQFPRTQVGMVSRAY